MHAIAVDFDWAQGSLAHGPRVPPGTAWWAGLPALLRGWARTRNMFVGGIVWATRTGAPVGTMAEVRIREDGDRGAIPAEAKDDAADVQATLTGDGESYARLVRRHQPVVAAYLWKFSRDRQQWEELVHDVFVEAYFSLGQYAGRAPLVHWLKRIATRVGYRHWKARRRRQREVPLPDDPDQILAVADDPEAAWQAGELVHRLLAELAPRDRLVMTLTYLEASSVAEIAALTGWSETMVKVQTHRARKRLAKICHRLGIEL
jgi:RNA polymerase sigma-70 factor (ECF subfamily)